MPEKLWIISDEPGYSWQETILKAAGWDLIDNDENWTPKLGLLYRITQFNWENSTQNEFKQIFLSQKSNKNTKQAISIPVESAEAHDLPGIAPAQVETASQSLQINLQPGQGTKIVFPTYPTTDPGRFSVESSLSHREGINLSLLLAYTGNRWESNYSYSQFTNNSLHSNQWQNLFTFFDPINQTITPAVQIINQGSQAVQCTLQNPNITSAHHLQSSFVFSENPTSLQPPGDFHILSLISQNHFDAAHDGYIHAALSGNVITNHFSQTTGQVRPYILNRTNNPNGPGSLSLKANGKPYAESASVFLRGTLTPGSHFAGAAFRRIKGTNGQITFTVFSENQGALSGLVMDADMVPTDKWQYFTLTNHSANSMPVFSIAQVSGGKTEIVVDDMKVRHFLLE